MASKLSSVPARRHGFPSSVISVLSAVFSPAARQPSPRLALQLAPSASRRRKKPSHHAPKKTSCLRAFAVVFSLRSPGSPWFSFLTPDKRVTNSLYPMSTHTVCRRHKILLYDPEICDTHITMPGRNRLYCASTQPIPKSPDYSSRQSYNAQRFFPRTDILSLKSGWFATFQRIQLSAYVFSIGAPTHIQVYVAYRIFWQKHRYPYDLQHTSRFTDSHDTQEGPTMTTIT